MVIYYGRGLSLSTLRYRIKHKSVLFLTNSNKVRLTFFTGKLDVFWYGLLCAFCKKSKNETFFTTVEFLKTGFTVSYLLGYSSRLKIRFPHFLIQFVSSRNGKYGEVWSFYDWKVFFFNKDSCLKNGFYKLYLETDH